MDGSSHSFLNLLSGDLMLPAYLPDATYGVVRSVDADDLKTAQVQAVVMNTFHLMLRPGSSTITALGGLHRMSGWDRPIVTDSGGFQAYSLIRQDPNLGKLSDKGLSFKPEGGKRQHLLTPEKSIQLQMSFGSDILIVLDDCTHAEAPRSEQQLSVQRTIAWAKRGKESYDRLVGQKKLDPVQRPLLFAVVQGGGEKDLRKQCAEALLEIGFDGFGYGGWPLDGEGRLLEEIVGYVRELIPPEYPLHALGVGHPQNVAACWQMGYDIFDSAMPTRDARHGRLYRFTQPWKTLRPTIQRNWMEYIYIHDEKHIRDNRPLSAECDCFSCRRYSIGYLRHLFKMNEILYQRLATIHNLRFMTQLMGTLRDIRRNPQHGTSGQEGC